MRTRTIGLFEVSAIGLGCMNMSMGYGPADEATSRQLLQEALDAGYTFLDTAAMYGKGHNETLIGETLKHRRNEYTLASKCGFAEGKDGKHVINGHPESLRKTCEDSLRRLQTDVIDLYYLHRADPNIPVEESIGVLGDMVAEGKLRTIGISEVSSETLRRAHQTHKITALQSEYSLWSRTPERKILDVCKELDIAFVPFSPLGRGFLTGKATDVNGMTENDLRITVGRPRFEPEAFIENSKLLVPFEEVAREQGCSMAQLALAWLLAKGDKSLIPIPGTKHIDYMHENLGAADIVLSQDVVDHLDNMINEETVVGARYNSDLMHTVDSEKD